MGGGGETKQKPKLTHTPLPILWGLKALITEAAERAGCVVTEAVTVTHSVVNTLINICNSAVTVLPQHLHLCTVTAAAGPRGSPTWPGWAVEGSHRRQAKKRVQSP